MRLPVLVGYAMLIGSAPAYAAGQIGETCNGTEVVRVGEQAPKTVPYSLTFSADLAAKAYCYGECRPDQSYPIKDGNSFPSGSRTCMSPGRSG